VDSSEYELKLKDPRWVALSKRIKERDGNQCRICERKSYRVPLDVHHRAYQLGREPWEYDSELLITLCRFCHEKVHIPKVQVYDQQGRLIEGMPCCSRCNGSGYLPAYRHVRDGICFGCWGSGRGFEMKPLIGEIKPFDFENRWHRIPSRQAGREESSE
jgi:hypothetical protein